MTATEWAYATGLFDGEGSIGLYPDLQDRMVLYVAVSMKGIPALQWLEANVGGKIYNQQDNALTGTDRGKRWVPDRTAFREFLVGILPYVVLKKVQVEVGLAFLDSVEDGGHLESAPGLHGERRKLKDSTRLVHLHLSNLLVAEKDRWRHVIKENEVSEHGSDPQ